MPDKDTPCQRCSKRPGGTWRGHAEYSWLCGACKVQVSLGGARGRAVAAKFSAELSTVTGSKITVETTIPNSDEEN